MNRISDQFPLKNTEEFKQQMLNWANRFNICCFLDNHQYPTPHPTVECLAGFGSMKIFSPAEGSLEQLDQFLSETSDWIFGHLGYDLKNQIAPLHSSHLDPIGFPDLFFFQPEIVIQLKDEECQIHSLTETPEKIFQQILKSVKEKNKLLHGIEIRPRIQRESYLDKIRDLLKHINRGDCYEINFCQAFTAENMKLDTVSVYHRLTEISPNPFSCYYKLQDKFLLCASPERWLQKKGERIISQPIKGTAGRNLQNEIEDVQLKLSLQKSEKDKQENVMIVDLVRNDLSQICTEGSVHVEELFGIYAFPQVYQMISTISGVLKKEIAFSDIIRSCFPMGSMTGAPKRKVMELIEQYENTKRGIYSGAVGYFHPNKDFDFNVVIRSILYNESNGMLCYQVGGGITAESIPEKEYEECLLKAEAIRKVLRQD